MAIYELGSTEIGKKRRVEENREYYERLVNMESHLRDRSGWRLRRLTGYSHCDEVAVGETPKM